MSSPDRSPHGFNFALRRGAGINFASQRLQIVAAQAFAGGNSLCPELSFTFTVTFGSNLLSSTFDDSVVLLDDVVQVLRLTHLHGQAAVGLEVLRLPPCWRRSC